MRRDHKHVMIAMTDFVNYRYCNHFICVPPGPVSPLPAASSVFSSLMKVSSDYEEDDEDSNLPLLDPVTLTLYNKVQNVTI